MTEFINVEFVISLLTIYFISDKQILNGSHHNWVSFISIVVLILKLVINLLVVNRLLFLFQGLYG